MKNKIYLITIILTGLVMISSCSKIESCEDIQLSRRKVIVNSNENRIEITAKSTWWWLSFIELNGNFVNTKNIDNYSRNFIYSHSDFQFERKEDGKKIVITMKQNNTNADRILHILLDAGDCSETIKIIQTK